MVEPIIEIKKAGALTSLEFWLDSPSDTFLEGIGKILVNTSGIDGIAWK